MLRSSSGRGLTDRGKMDGAAAGPEGAHYHQGFNRLRQECDFSPASSAATGMASSDAGFLNPGAHAACEKYLHHTGENQQRAERSRESNNPPRFNDRFSGSDLNFFRPRGHAHLRMYQRGDPGSHEQNSHHRNWMEFHINKSARAEKNFYCANA